MAVSETGVAWSDFSEDWMIFVPTFVAWTIDAYALLHYFVFASDDDMAEDDAAEDDPADEGSSSYGGYYYYY